jgi:hypothetical protein
LKGFAVFASIHNQEELFSKLQHQEGIHLARLKEVYEKFYMSQM